MRRIPIRALVLVLALVLSAASARSARATWAIDGIPVATGAGDQLYPMTLADGSGGAFVLWQDHRGSDFDIYVQRISASGTPLWTGNGVAVSTVTGDQLLREHGAWTYAPDLVSDGAGGVIVTWYDHRGADYDIYAQRINAAGVPQWTPDGVPVCTAAADQMHPTIVGDGAGGAIVTWRDFRTSGSTGVDVYAQRLDATGAPQWTADGVVVTNAAGDQQLPTACSDGAGGAVISWYDYRSGGADIYAQRLSGSGSAQWTANGVALCTAGGDQLYPELIPDGTGGAIVTWMDRRTGEFDIYAQRINGSGTQLWTAGGLGICVYGTHDQDGPSIISDGAGGAIIAWYDWRNFCSSFTCADIYAQRVSSSGVTQWTANGAPLASLYGDQVWPLMVPDGSGGAVVAFWDDRIQNPPTAGWTAPTSIYATRATSSGTIASGWPSVAAGGVPVASLYSDHSTIASDGAGGAIIVWQDQRSGNYDVYAARILAEGTNAAAPSTACAPLPANAVGYWPADGDLLDVAGSNPLTAQNGAVLGPGFDCQGLQMDGVDDYFTAPDAPALRPKSMTIEGWFNFASTSNGRILVTKSVGTGGQNSFALFWNGSAIYGVVSDLSNFGPFLGAAYTPPLGTWHHYAYTFDDDINVQCLYIDGVLVNSGSVTTTIAWDAHPFMIGAESDHEVIGGFFAGKADEVAFYSRALSAAEIQAIYAVGAKSKCKPNRAPTLAALPPQTVDEQTLVSLTATASDLDCDQTLTFSLDSPPPGAAIDGTSGLFTWTPGEAQGPNDYSITVRVTDNGVPPMSDAKMLAVHVNEVNRRPVLDPIASQDALMFVPMSFTAHATDPDLPANTLTYDLGPVPPAGASIDPGTGVFTWNPTATGRYSVLVRVHDGGMPTLADSQTVTIDVGTWFHGYQNFDLGAGQVVSVGHDTLRVTGIGGSGADGVRIVPPGGTRALKIRFSLPDEAMITPGAYLQVSSRLRGYAPTDSVGFTRMTRLATANHYAITGAIAGGTLDKVLGLYSGGAPVYSDTRANNAINPDAITPRGLSANDDVGGIRTNGPGAASTLILRWKWDEPTTITVTSRPGGLADTVVTADELRLMDPNAPTDTTAFAEISEFLVRAANLDGFSLLDETSTTTGVSPDPGPAPAGDGLWLAVPAPNPSLDAAASFAFRLVHSGRVTLEVIDLAGRLRSSRASETFEAGSHTVRWRAGPLAPGLYLVRLRTDSGGSIVRRWVILR